MSAQKNITQLNVGEHAFIAEFSNGFIACKLMAMGLLPGSEIMLVRKAPFGGACYIRAKQHYVVLRNKEAEHVIIDSVVS